MEDPGEQIEFKVMDKDFGKSDDLVGTLTIDVKDLVIIGGPPKNEWYHLDYKGKKAGEI